MGNDQSSETKKKLEQIDSFLSALPRPLKSKNSNGQYLTVNEINTLTRLPFNVQEERASLNIEDIEFIAQKCLWPELVVNIEKYFEKEVVDFTIELLKEAGFVPSSQDYGATAVTKPTQQQPQRSPNEQRLRTILIDKKINPDYPESEYSFVTSALGRALGAAVALARFKDARIIFDAAVNISKSVPFSGNIEPEKIINTPLKPYCPIIRRQRRYNSNIASSENPDQAVESDSELIGKAEHGRLFLWTPLQWACAVRSSNSALSDGAKNQEQADMVEYLLANGAYVNGLREDFISIPQPRTNNSSHDIVPSAGTGFVGPSSDLSVPGGTDLHLSPRSASSTTSLRFVINTATENYHPIFIAIQHSTQNERIVAELAAVQECFLDGGEEKGTDDGTSKEMKSLFSTIVVNNSHNGATEPSWFHLRNENLAKKAITLDSPLSLLCRMYVSEASWRNSSSKKNNDSKDNAASSAAAALSIATTLIARGVNTDHRIYFRNTTPPANKCDCSLDFAVYNESLDLVKLLLANSKEFKEKQGNSPNVLSLKKKMEEWTLWKVEEIEELLMK